MTRSDRQTTTQRVAPTTRANAGPEALYGLWASVMEVKA